MTINSFLEKLKQSPNDIAFADTMDVIEANYDFTPTSFQNGGLQNSPGENSGSCKLFSFAKLQNLSELETLACFGSYYFKEVLEYPDAENHKNIRNFMKTGWSGIFFDQDALTLKGLQ